MKNRGFPYISTPAICTLIAFSVTVSGQTQVDISKQGKNVDFTGAPYTRPVKTGTALPGTCSMGDMFLNVSAAAGRNLYACTAANTWTVQAAAANSGLPDPGTNGIVVRTALNQDTAVPAPNGTVVGTSDTQTLTNKSIDASEINSGVLPGARMPAFSGDISSTAGGTTATLATVNSTPGTFGGASSIPVITVNGKGLITGISTVTAAAGTGTVGGGTGASSVAMQTSDLAVTGTGTTITSGASCSSSTPCLIYINGIRYPFTGSSSLSISGSGSETIWHYVDPNNGGKETWGYPSGSQNTYTASGTAVVTSGITAVPADAYPLAQCTVTTGSVTSCIDIRPILSMSNFVSGAGTTIATTSSGTTINVSIPVVGVMPNQAIPTTAWGYEYDFSGGGNSGMPTPTGSSGSVPNGWFFYARNTGSTNVTLSPTGATINGQSTMTVTPGQIFRVRTDGTNYLADGFGGSSSGNGGGALPPAPIQEWHLNENGLGAALIESTGHTNNIAPTSATYSNTINGMPLLTFDGTSSYAQAANQTYTNFDGTQPFSVSLWFSTTAITGGQQTLASTLDSANSYKGWEVSYDGAYANGSIAVYLINIDPTNAIELIFSGFTAISANTMHHVVFSYDGSKSASGVMVCMDGTCKTSASSTIANNLTGSTSNTIDMLLGKRTDGTNFLSGTLSDIRIYNYKLSSTQVSSLFSAGIQ